MLKLLKLVAVAAATALLLPQLALGDTGVRYKVTITNLTAGQAFTPPVIAVHNRRAEVFSLGKVSSDGIRAIAENGNNGPLVTALSSDTNVYTVIEGTEPLVPAANPGETPFSNSVQFTVSTSRHARFLSIAAMLICTNDGFTGVNSVALPWRKRTVYAVAYDARSEQNTEDFADIVPPCQGLIGEASDDTGTGMSNPLLAESGVIIPHAGIVGDQDLNRRVHEWADPVAKIEIERIRHRY